MGLCSFLGKIKLNNFLFLNQIQLDRQQCCVFFLSCCSLLLHLHIVGAQRHLGLQVTEGTSWLPSAIISPTMPTSLSSWKLAMHVATVGPTFPVREVKSIKRSTQCAYTTDATVCLPRETREEPLVTTPS